jgi:hypothetical protein
VSGRWMQTNRKWGSGRTLRGVSHYMMQTGESSMVAMCGYVPHEHTVMRPEPEEMERRGRCERCESKESSFEIT